jgi:hypothetical protein
MSLQPARAPADSPYGSDPTRSKTPIIVLAVGYAIWSVLLLLMAMQQVGAR